MQGSVRALKTILTNLFIYFNSTAGTKPMKKKKNIKKKYRIK